MSKKPRPLKRADVSGLVGLPVVVHDAAQEYDEPEGAYIGVPRLEELTAAAAITLCQMTPSLRGIDMKALRKILGLSQPGLAEALGGKTAALTISRWENESAPISDYAEKLFRLLVCETLRARAPAMPYEARSVISMTIAPRKAKVAPMEFRREQRKVGRSIEDVWIGPAVHRVASAA